MAMRLLRPKGDGTPSLRLDGARVYLRPPVEDDFEPWAALREASRPFLTPWEPTWSSDTLTLPAYRRRIRQYAADWRGDQGYTFFVFRRADDALAGGVGLTNVRRGIVMSASLGYWMGESFAGLGFGTDAVRAVIRFAFGHLLLNRVEAACIPENEPSRRLLLRVGFEQEGYARRYLRINGAWRDHLLFAMLSDRSDPRPDTRPDVRA